MRCDSEIDTVQSIDKDIEYHTTRILRLQENIKGSRQTLQTLYKQKNYLLFWDTPMKPWLREILSEIPHWESILVEYTQSKLWAYLQRVPGKKFKTRKEGTFTRVYCL